MNVLLVEELLYTIINNTQVLFFKEFFFCYVMKLIIINFWEIVYKCVRCLSFSRTLWQYDKLMFQGISQYIMEMIQC